MPNYDDLLYDIKETIHDISFLPHKLTKKTIRWWQRRTRGWDDSECWDLDSSFCEWIYPRLLVYKEQAPEVIEISPEFMQAIDDMIEGFMEWKGPWTSESLQAHAEKRDKAFKQFAQWHNYLWW